MWDLCCPEQFAHVTERMQVGICMKTALITRTQAHIRDANP